MDTKAIYQRLFSTPGYALHAPGEFRYEWAIKAIRSIHGINSVLDLGSGRGMLAKRLASELPDVHCTTADIAKFHSLDLPHANLDLASRQPIPGNYDFAACLDVLEHLEADVAAWAIGEIARVSRFAAFTIANHSDVIGGVELHLTQQDAEWWFGIIDQSFRVIKMASHYNGRLYCFVLESR